MSENKAHAFERVDEASLREMAARQGMETFSIGVFPWEPRVNGDGMKRGKSVVRVKGWAQDPEPVYDCALEIAGELDRGTYAGPKVVDVRKVAK